MPALLGEISPLLGALDFRHFLNRGTKIRCAIADISEVHFMSLILISYSSAKSTHEDSRSVPTTKYPGLISYSSANTTHEDSRSVPTTKYPGLISYSSANTTHEDSRSVPTTNYPGLISYSSANTTHENSRSVPTTNYPGLITSTCYTLLRSEATLAWKEFNRVLACTLQTVHSFQMRYMISYIGL